MQLKNKRILLISSESWDHIKLSKHHYAMELAAMGNQVFFLNPPKNEKKYLNFFEERINENLVVIQNSLFFPYRLKNHFNFLFNFLLNFQIKKINKHYGKMDVVWSFSSFYQNLKKFNASLHIYHTVDRLQGKPFIKTAEHADFLFCVTKEIASKFTHKKKHLIDHGLSSLFFRKAYQQTKSYENESIHVAYCGNLTIKSLDRPLVLNLIKNHPKITFHLIGPYQSSDNAIDFINGLKSANNVKLYGKVTPEEISEIYENMDAFILCYDRNSTFAQNRNASSNSHKLLEYISTGKVVISTNMTAYNDKKDLIEMLDTDDNEGYLELFDQVINNLSEYNSEERLNKRFEFAKQNSYTNRIKEIEQIITNNY